MSIKVERKQSRRKSRRQSRKQSRKKSRRQSRRKSMRKSRRKSRRKSKKCSNMPLEQNSKIIIKNLVGDTLFTEKLVDDTRIAPNEYTLPIEVRKKGWEFTDDYVTILPDNIVEITVVRPLFSDESIRIAVELWFTNREECENNYGPISNWNVSLVTNMAALFANATTLRRLGESGKYNTENFNEPLNNWDVSNVTNMAAMFMGAKSFNQPLNNWDVSNVTNMEAMFMGAESFNQPLNNWDVSNVTNMELMFMNAESFDQILSSWDLSNTGANVFKMFEGATAFMNNELIYKIWDSKWDTYGGFYYRPREDYLEELASEGLLTDQEYQTALVRDDNFLYTLLQNKRNQFG